MRRCLPLLLAVLLFVGAPSRPAAAREEDEAFGRAVADAIERGRAWLEGRQRPDGAFGALGGDVQDLGRQALAVFTLAKCGADPDERHVALGLEAHRRLEAQFAESGSLTTYSVAVSVLMLDALHREERRPRRRGDPPRCRYPAGIARKIREAVDWLVAHRARRVWRYPGDMGEGVDEDLSNTQYALLALQAAGRCGVAADGAVYEAVLEHLLAVQQATGPEVPWLVPNPAWEPGREDGPDRFYALGTARARGWGYLERAGVSVTGSMTSAGVACLAIAKERLKAGEALDARTERGLDEAMRDGLAWLGLHFAVDANPGQEGWHYYYLYGLERAGALTGLEHFGEHFWYRRGAEHLLAAQEEDGSWPPAVRGPWAAFEDRLVRTCFALLFLRRATPRPPIPLGPVVTED